MFKVPPMKIRLDRHFTLPSPGTLLRHAAADRFFNVIFISCFNGFALTLAGMPVLR